MENKETYEFVIAGLPYKLRSSHRMEVVTQLVQLVDQRVREALYVTKSGSIQNAAILAALNLAEELVLLKKQALEELQNFEDRNQKLRLEWEKLKSESARHEIQKD